MGHVNNVSFGKVIISICRSEFSSSFDRIFLFLIVCLLNNWDFPEETEKNCFFCFQVPVEKGVGAEQQRADRQTVKQPFRIWIEFWLWQLFGSSQN